MSAKLLAIHENSNKNGENFENNFENNFDNIVKAMQGFGDDEEEPSSTKQYAPRLKEKESEQQSRKTIYVPLDIFPSDVASVINKMSDIYKCPTDYYLVGALAACSVAIGNSLKVATTDGREGVICSLYACIVAPSSAGKTPTLNWCFKKIREMETKLNADFEEANKKYLLEKVDDKTAIEPVREKILTTKGTLEGVLQVVKKSKRGAVMFRDELVGLLNAMNQYNKGDDEEQYLSIWSGTQVIQDNVKNSLHIDNPFLTIVGGTQPKKVCEFTKNDRLESGLVQRFLFSYPEYAIENKDHRAKMPNFESYSNLIEKLLLIRELKNEKTIYLTEEAIDQYQAYSNELTSERKKDSDGYWSSYLGKLEQYALRFSLIIECFKELKRPYVVPDAIELDSMKNAIELCRYFEQHALKVFARIEDPISTLSKGKRELYDSLPDKFTKAQANICAEDVKMSKATLERFLKDKQFFKNESHGNYLKQM